MLNACSRINCCGVSGNACLVQDFGREISEALVLSSVLDFGPTHTYTREGGEMATHSSILAWELPWTEEPGGLQSRGCKELDTS